MFACYGKLAHHREVVLVDGHGARESVGVLCDGQDGVPSPAEGALGTIEDLDLKYVADRRVRCMVSCELCAGLPLGGCIDRGHQQQVGGGKYGLFWFALRSRLLGGFLRLHKQAAAMGCVRSQPSFLEASLVAGITTPVASCPSVKRRLSSASCLLS